MNRNKKTPTILFSLACTFAASAALANGGSQVLRKKTTLHSQQFVRAAQQTKVKVQVKTGVQQGSGTQSGDNTQTGSGLAQGEDHGTDAAVSIGSGTKLGDATQTGVGTAAASNTITHGAVQLGLSAPIGGYIKITKSTQGRPIIKISSTWITSLFTATKAPVRIDPLTISVTNVAAGDRLEFQTQDKSAKIEADELPFEGQGLAITAGRAVRFKTVHTVKKVPKKWASVGRDGQVVDVKFDNEIEVPVHAVLRTVVNDKTTSPVVSTVGKQTRSDVKTQVIRQAGHRDGAKTTVRIKSGLLQHHVSPFVQKRNVFDSGYYADGSGKEVVDLALLAALPIGSRVEVRQAGNVIDEFFADDTGSGRVTLPRTKSATYTIRVISDGDPGRSRTTATEFDVVVAKSPGSLALRRSNIQSEPHPVGPKAEAVIEGNEQVVKLRRTGFGRGLPAKELKQRVTELFGPVMLLLSPLDSETLAIRVDETQMRPVDVASVLARDPELVEDLIAAGGVR